MKHRLPVARIAATLSALALSILAAPGAPALEGRELRDLMVPMRDGVRLATDVYLPAGDGPWPVVLQRTPYGKRPGNAARYNEREYVFVVQDQRGTFGSEGSYVAHENEMRDGYDTVEWIAAQPWCDGKVGISGGSALGIAANLAAAADPPHLAAAYVVVAPESLFFEGRFIGGMFKEADTGNWMRARGVSEDEILAYRRRVVLDERWQSFDFVFQRPNVDVPIYNVGGWYDLFLKGTIDNFRYLQEWGRPGARGNQKLWVGAFGHGALRGDLAYPEGGRPGLEEELRWFDYWLRGIDNGIMDEPPVRWYQRAAARRGSPEPHGEWRTAERWPPPEGQPVRLYLQPDLGLDWRPPAVGRASTRYRFDPARPVPTVGGLNLTLPLGPMDQRQIEPRPDYLRFETPPLDRELALAGPLAAELWVSTDVPDTDFVVKVVDVYPDGYEALILDGGLRTRFRHGRRAEDVAMMEPGRAVRLEIELWHTGITLPPGHRLAVHVTSSNHPRFDVNPNTGAAPGQDGEPRIATNVVHHDAERPSALILPVLTGEPDLPTWRPVVDR